MLYTKNICFFLALRKIIVYLQRNGLFCFKQLVINYFKL